MAITLAELLVSVDTEAVPAAASAVQRALWQDARGDWDGAHRTVQSESDAASAWVHAYLHRKEGDLNNARYWYGRAGKTPSEATLADEWQEIAAALSDV